MMVIHIKFSSVKNLLDINSLNVRPPCSFLLNLVENSAVICWSIRLSKHSLWQRNVAKRFYCLVSKWVALPSCSLCWGFEHNFVIFNFNFQFSMTKWNLASVTARVFCMSQESLSHGYTSSTVYLSMHLHELQLKKKEYFTKMQ